MSAIKTPPTTDKYREGWERIFGKGKNMCPRCNGEGEEDYGVDFRNMPQTIVCQLCKGTGIIND